MIRRRMAPRLAQGQAGVYTVAAQLLLRRINPSFPAVDCGADIITDWGTRIQVKCSRKVSTVWGGSYRFPLDSGITIYPRDGAYRKTSIKGKAGRIFSDECDFFVMWGINDNRFWIVPSTLLDGKTLVTMVGPFTPWLTTDISGIRSDRAAGMAICDIAEKHSMDRNAVSRILSNVNRKDVDTEFCKLLLSHENRWDLIHADESLLSEGEAHVDASATAEEV